MTTGTTGWAVCDRCGLRVESGEPVTERREGGERIALPVYWRELFITQAGQGFVRAGLDLCRECFDDFGLFIGNEQPVNGRSRAPGEEVNLYRDGAALTEAKA
jgi:hypothetical protein